MRRWSASVDVVPTAGRMRDDAEPAPGHIGCGLIRLVAGPVVAAGIIGGAVGSAAVANASTPG
jgi:hypothetical protein